MSELARDELQSPSKRTGRSTQHHSRSSRRRREHHTSQKPSPRSLARRSMPLPPVPVGINAHGRAVQFPSVLILPPLGRLSPAAVVGGRIVCVLRRIGADISRAVVEADAVNPVIDIAPRVFNAAILYAAIACPGGSDRAGVVGHAVRRTRLLQRGIADNTVADFALAIPVCILDEIEQPDRAPRRIIVLLPLAALFFREFVRAVARVMFVSGFAPDLEA